MSNTTDILLCCFVADSKVVEKLSKETEINFIKVSDGQKSGGPKVLSIDAYGACYLSLGRGKITEIIEVFKGSNFIYPELASLTIDDDDIFHGVITLTSDKEIT